MKKLIVSASLLAIASFFTGCATPYPVGGLVTEVQLPVLATNNVIDLDGKKGVSTCKSYFSLIALGDASIQEAADEGGITKITHVDWSVTNVLGVYGEYTVTVYGE